MVWEKLRSYRGDSDGRVEFLRSNEVVKEVVCRVQSAKGFGEKTERGKVYYVLNVSNFHNFRGSNINVEYDTHNQRTTHILHFNYNRL